MSRKKRKEYRDSPLLYLDVFFDVILYLPRLVGKMVKWIVEAI
ncbi:hypothetical protein [Pontibacillus chungwhensis]|nr:hypothetical protein [Pontibacillus chungwhensis]